MPEIQKSNVGRNVMEVVRDPDLVKKTAVGSQILTFCSTAEPSAVRLLAPDYGEIPIEEGVSYLRKLRIWDKGYSYGAPLIK